MRGRSLGIVEVRVLVGQLLAHLLSRIRVERVDQFEQRVRSLVEEVIVAVDLVELKRFFVAAVGVVWAFGARVLPPGVLEDL